MRQNRDPGNPRPLWPQIRWETREGHARTRQHRPSVEADRSLWPTCGLLLLEQGPQAQPHSAPWCLTRCPVPGLSRPPPWSPRAVPLGLLSGKTPHTLREHSPPATSPPHWGPLSAPSRAAQACSQCPLVARAVPALLCVPRVGVLVRRSCSALLGPPECVSLQPLQEVTVPVLGDVCRPGVIIRRALTTGLG